MARRLKGLVAVALVAAVIGCAAPSPNGGSAAVDCPDGVGSPSTSSEKRVSYGPDPAHLLDLLPACTEHAVGTIMFVPGGGYTALRRSMAHHENVRRLRDQGWVVLVVDYRLAPSNRWPTQGADVRRAINWWRTTGATGFAAPAAPLVGVGWSAGGHLAEWATVRTDGASFDAGISVSGATYWPERLDRDAAIALLGPSPSTARQLDASTVPHLDASDPPLLHLHAENDRVVVVRQAELLADRIEHHGDPDRHRVVIDPSCSHSIRCLIPEHVDPFLDEVRAAHATG